MPTLCETYSQGEVEDYSLRILAPVPEPPVAEFTAEKTNITIGESVQFNDLTQNEPTSWQWSFPGGTPSSSNEKNPKVSYNLPGEYDVTLEASKDGFTPSKKINYKFIVADNNLSKDYCIPAGISSSPDFIQNVSIGNVLNNTTAGNGYSLSANTVALEPGQSYKVSLNPKVSTNRNYWKIWIDLNGDGDFTDSDETLLTVSNKKGTISATITIPAYALVNSRMRIAMRTGSAPAPCDDNFSGEVEDYPVSFGADVQAAAEAPPKTMQSVSHRPKTPVIRQLCPKIPAVKQLYRETLLRFRV
jgi:PKD repeat protein